ncbi:cobaltochelatase subunit CobN [Alicycliphilus denitrificans]|uniref:cobaltochelatase subunit CobN n=1 Tax=Alicycliphilus denitrificans TaxID=179636 RepID=UPI00384C21C3
MTINHKLRWLLCAALLLLAGAARAASVLFIATGNVPQGKFHQLAEIARPHGLTVEVRYLNSLPADVDAGLWRGWDAVFFDSYLQDEVRSRLVRALPALKAPNAWLYDAKPAWGGGLSEAVARRLIHYYASGGRQNYEGFFATLAAQLAGGKPLVAAPDPVVFPKTGVYHPRWSGLVTADVHAFLRSQGVDLAAPARKPVVAIALHQQYIGAMQTAFIDDMVARIEAGGAVALPFYTPMMGEGGFPRVLQPAGPGTPVLADVLINTQITLNADERRAEFERMGIPVIQAMTYRRGDEADWAANPQGVATMDVPFYLAQAEYAGITDIQVASATRKGDEQIMPIAPQAAAVAAKALNLVKLQRKPHADKQVAVMFWNYPAGEKNLSASFLNVPRSLQGTLAAMAAAGYRTEVPDETHLITLLQRLLAPAYRGGELAPLLQDGLAALLPVQDYRAWLSGLPQPTQDALRSAWGAPEKSHWVIRRGGQDFFVIPRLQLGRVTLLPQPGRSGMAPGSQDARAKEKEIYHSTTNLPPHHYLATYLWTRQHNDALVHYGTHGTQEWLPGKERGLSVHDAPLLALGDIPVAYPYIADNIGEATQAKRRGRATIVSHQTPPFAPGGLHDALTQMHDLLHQWQAQDEGAVRERMAADLLAAARKERLIADMGWTEAKARERFADFVQELHNHLHELAQTAQPQGLHTLGRAPEELHRLGTVLLMLGKNFWEAAAQHAGVPAADIDEALVGPWDKLEKTAPYQLLQRHVVAGEGLDGLPANLQKALRDARQAYDNLGAQGELAGLLAVLDGRYLPTSYGGDPIKNPDAYPTGRNLYGFDPSRVPTKQAWEAGKQAAENLLAEHQRLHGRLPKKLTFSLWSVETMRHFGLLEAQALWLLGVEPVWDGGGRVTGVKLVERGQLGRARVDVVLSATGLYRDHFPNVMKQLAQAVLLAARAREADNPVAANAQRIAQKMMDAGADAQAAELAGATRIFASESGRYGTGLDDAALATDTWKGKAEGDRKLARLYLDKMQFAYGPDESQWGRAGVGGVGDGKGGKAVNLYAEHLSGTEGAVLSRSSNLYGMLTTDDPFQYLGGIALAVRHLDGKAPELYISNLRGSGAGRVEGAAQFLAKELATRQFHPGYIQGLMKEGYAGTLQVLDATNNFWGWTATAREIVRDDQWQEMVDVYVRDKHQLGLQKWFESKNPHALAQTMERMLEAARQGYWQADAATVRELKERWRDLSRRFDVHTDNARFAAFVADGAPNAAQAGYGLQAPMPAADAQQAQPEAQAEPQPTAPPVVTGMRLAKVDPPQAPPLSPATALFALALAGISGAGALAQRRSNGFSLSN